MKGIKTITSNKNPKKTKGYWLEPPGPGHYNPESMRSKSECKAGFMSKTLRNFMRIGKNPPPNRYRITRAIIPKKPYKNRGGTANFKAPTRKRKRDMIEGFLKYRKIRKKKEVPGPGTYHHDEPKDYLADDKNLRITSQF